MTRPRKPEQIRCMWAADLAAAYYQESEGSKLHHLHIPGFFPLELECLLLLRIKSFYHGLMIQNSEFDCLAVTLLTNRLTADMVLLVKTCLVVNLMMLDDSFQDAQVCL